MLNVLFMVNFFVLLYFGMFISASFLGIELNKKNFKVLLPFGLILFLLQVHSYFSFGISVTEKLYPLFSHIPLLVLYMIYYKHDFFSSFFSVMSSYLFCQFSKWFGLLAITIFDNKTVYYITRIIVTIIMLYVIIRFLSVSVMLILKKSKRIIITFGILPFIYYVFDYATTVYSNLLYSGSILYFEFLPLALCVAYLIFCTIYFKEYEEKCKTERHMIMMVMKNKQAVRELESIKRSELEISILRHDMRHFLNNILYYIEKADNEKAVNYIEEIIKSTNRTVPDVFCSNELINMVLSSYKNRMSEYGIKFETTVQVPEKLTCSDADITSILSNGLENAINATSEAAPEKRVINLSLITNDNKLLLSIKNPYINPPLITNDLPVSCCPGHGFGTQSIKYVASKLKGNCQFSANDGIFTLRVVI